LNGAFCLAALEQSPAFARAEVFCTDLGAQFTANAFTIGLHDARVRISMVGGGRMVDNTFVDRPWRAVKCESIYLKKYVTMPVLTTGLQSYFGLCNTERPH
jgi:putative transposase